MTTMRDRRRAFAWQVLLGAAVVAVVASPAPVAAQAAAEEEVTFSKHIAPILQRSCQKCHRPDSLAPMSLIDYNEVRPWARAIKYRTGLRDKLGVMPPWYIEKDIGIQRFKDDPSLSDRRDCHDRDVGRQRGAAGRSRRPAAAAGVHRRRRVGDRRARPDPVVAERSRSRPTQPDWWGSIGEVPTGLTEDRYVAAMEYKEVTESREGDARATPSAGCSWCTTRRSAVTDPDPDPNENDPLAPLRRWPTHEVGRNADFFDPQAPAGS